MNCDLKKKVMRQSDKKTLAIEYEISLTCDFNAPAHMVLVTDSRGLLHIPLDVSVVHGVDQCSVALC